MPDRGDSPHPHRRFVLGLAVVDRQPDVLLVDQNFLCLYRESSRDFRLLLGPMMSVMINSDGHVMTHSILFRWGIYLLLFLVKLALHDSKMPVSYVSLPAPSIFSVASIVPQVGMSESTVPHRSN